jgi:hypothetical protein
MCMRRSWREERARKLRREDLVRDLYDRDPAPERERPLPIVEEREPEPQARPEHDPEKVTVGI